jgi:hypothetical protein
LAAVVPAVLRLQQADLLPAPVVPPVPPVPRLQQADLLPAVPTVPPRLNAAVSKGKNT